MKTMKYLVSFLPGATVLALGCLYVGYFGVQFYYCPPVSPSDWATWAGSIGTVTAVVVAAFAIYAQNKSAHDLERLRHDQDEAATLLSLCYLGREVRQMITLTGFQVSAQGNPIIYPNISADFASMAAMIGGLPIERVAGRSAVGYALHLRRIALHMSELYSVEPAQGSDYFLFNRARISDLQRQCGLANQDLMQMLEMFAPELYGQHKDKLHQL